MVLAVMLCVLLTVWLLLVVPHTVPLAEVEGEPVLLAVTEPVPVEDTADRGRRHWPSRRSRGRRRRIRRETGGRSPRERERGVRGCNR